MSNQFKRQIFQVSQQGQAVCEQLERGQADTPLAEHFRQIETDIESAPFSIVLLGLTTEARTAALAWFYGKDFSVLSVNVAKQLGLVEINLREQGYTIERSDGNRLEFDRLDPFMQALQESDVLNPNDGDQWVDPVRLGINTSQGLQGLKVYMPESPEMILKNPGLLNRVVTQANLLVVAAPLHYDLSDQDQQAILEISQNMDGFWPLLVVDELEEDTNLPSIGWWQKHKAPTVQLKPQLLTTHVAAKVPGMLQDMDDATRQALFLYLQACRVIHASEAVQERAQQEARQLQSRKTREQRKAKAGESDVKADATERHEWDNIRNYLNDEMTRLNKNIQELGKKALLPDSTIVSQLDQFIGRLQVDDLNQEPGHKSVKLTVKDSFLNELKNNVKGLLKNQLRNELASLSSNLKTQQEKIETDVRELSGQPQSLPLTSADESAVWGSLKEQLSVSVRYRGEMPKRGFMSRLGDGRKAIMGISMMAMIIGGVFKAVWGIDFRAMIMIIAPLIFIGAVVYSFIVWPKEDAERLSKELDKVRDGLSSELKRLLNELQRDKQSKINDHLDNEKKSVTRKLEEIMRETQSQQDKASGQQKEQAQTRIQQIDQQVRDLQNIERDITGLMRQCETLERDGKQQLNNLG